MVLFEPDLQRQNNQAFLISTIRKCTSTSIIINQTNIVHTNCNESRLVSQGKLPKLRLRWLPVVTNWVNWLSK